nr:uncharacterized protein LOC129433961 isoform X4 [Misgurnus anguillicaudatus]
MPEAKFKVTTARPLGLIMSAICRPHFTISFLVLHPKLNRLDCLSRTTGTLQGFASHIDVIDEERYDTGVKAAKNEKEKEEVIDWRKNVEAMSGMEGRKKLLDDC